MKFGDMEPPPPGSVQSAVLGDKPVNAQDEYDFPPGAVQVVCVLTGDWPGCTAEHRQNVKGDMGAHYVKMFYSMVSKYAPLNTIWRFTCFTDRLELGNEVPCKPIPVGMYSFFSKLYLFKQGLFPVGTRVLFFDLDTAITKGWGPLAKVPLDKPVFLRDLWGASRPASGVMSWEVSDRLSAIWRDFESQAQNRPPYDHPSARSGIDGLTWDIRTDEQWLHHYLLPDKWAAWQDLLPGHFLSYKYDIMRQMRVNGNFRGPLTAEEAQAAGVVYFHGRPRPHEVVHSWNPFSRGVIL